MILTLEEIVKKRTFTKGVTVFTGGCFDILHIGHIEYLEFAKSQGDLLFVGVSSDERVSQRKGPNRPVNNEQARVRIIDSLRPVDYTFIMPMPLDDTSPTIQVVKTLKPDIFVIYQDSLTRHGDKSDLEVKLRQQNTKLVIDERDKMDSTSDLMGRADLQ